MKKIKKISKVIVISLSIVFSLLVVSAVSFYHVVTKGVSLNNEKLEKSISQTLKIYDKNSNEINLANHAIVNIKELSSHTINAFVCTEDKRFYSHNGVDYIRIGGAIISNLKSKSFSEGASTISQQLIKNTLLSNEKTIKRKLKEFKLARALEKQYSKAEILEMYLNNIYFGNGNYGIENASIYYFGKSASSLTISESALLAGTINAPSVYDIQNNTEKAIERRNLILSIMQNADKITDKEYNQAINEPVNLNITKVSNNNYMFNEILKESSKILGLTENELKNQDIEIYTNYDSNTANSIVNLIKTNYQDVKDLNIATFIIDNETNTIISVSGNSKTLSSKKQPGSTIKPILVYAPAIENNMISPSTKILDEEINISGYSPTNADGKYHGFVTVHECLKNSYNIPAVKLLNELGISNSQNFAKKLNIDFEDNDNHLAIALGGFSKGTTLKQLADAYTAFANSGYFADSKYITEIKINNKTIYKKSPARIKAMQESTAKSITSMLIDASKTGTAKKLADLNYQIASKTGTVGKENSNKNTDAYCISYTSKHTILTYIGDNNLSSKINGATYPSLINKNICEILYKKYKPKNLLQTNKTVTTISNQDLFSPETENPLNELNLTLTVDNNENRKPILKFFASKNYIYNIIRKDNKKEEIISSFKSINNSKNIKFEDISAKNNEIYEYFVEICEKSTTKKYYTNHVKLKAY